VESATIPNPSTGVDWRRAEFILTGLAFLGFFTLPIRLTTIYSGLPAHPLFVHVPVVLIPVSVLGGLACLVRPQWFEKYGILLCGAAIVAMSSIFLTMQAGAALESALHISQGPDASLIHQHSQAAHILAIIFVLFTAVLILNFAASRIGSGRPTGLGIADQILGSAATGLALKVLLVILALVSAYMVYRVGDLGAKAVWAGRLNGGGGAGFPFPGAHGPNGYGGPAPGAAG
jgi:hypothetical protein